MHGLLFVDFVRSTDQRISFTPESFSEFAVSQNSVALTVKNKESIGDLPPICGYISGTIQYIQAVRLLFSTSQQSCMIYGTDTADD